MNVLLLKPKSRPLSYTGRWTWYRGTNSYKCSWFIDLVYL